MNYRSTLMTAGAAVALAGLANAQTNGDYDHNWASLSNGPAALLLDPAFFAGNLGLLDSIRFCYSIDVSQGGRNQTGATYVSWFNVAQAFGGNNSQLGVDIGPIGLLSVVSSDLTDDACLADFYGGFGLTAGTASTGSTLALGAPGLISGTGGYSLNQGFFWNIVFEFVGTALPGVNNTAGVDPVNVFGAPLLTHLVYEIQGPVTGGPTNKQYFLGSSSELNGATSPGGVTNGNGSMGLAQYGVTADQSGAIQGNRVIVFDEVAGTIGGGPVALLGGTDGEIEWKGAIALQTPYFTGVNNGNAGGGGADWNLSGAAGALSTIDVRVIDKLAGGQSATSGAVVSDPGLVFNSSFMLWSATPALGTLQNALSWDDIFGSAPPQAGTYLLPAQATSRAGSQRFHVNFDATTSSFLNLGFSLLKDYTGALDPNVDPAGVGDLFNFNPTTGTTGFATGPIALSTPAAGAAGKRLGMNSIGLQVSITTGGAISFTEISSARTAVLQ